MEGVSRFELSVLFWRQRPLSARSWDLAPFRWDGCSACLHSHTPFSPGNPAGGWGGHRLAAVFQCEFSPHMPHVFLRGLSILFLSHVAAHLLERSAQFLDQSGWSSCRFHSVCRVVDCGG